MITTSLLDSLTHFISSSVRLQKKINDMQNIPHSISVTSAVFLFFLFVCGFDEATDIILFLFTLLNIMVVWMVYSILRFEYVSPYTFQERFYENVDHKRIKDEDK